ncbi:DMT family transporter [Candidatus Dependentiae bacterium]|nr:DMT family transporter [Candidatus Dependentiae bacterium]
MLLVALLYAILASTFILAKKALMFGKPFFLIGFRMTIAGILLFSYASLFRKFRIKNEDWWLFFKVALFHIYFSFILEFWALQYLSALKTTLIYSSTPFIAALLSYFLLSERLSASKIFGIGIGMCGMIPVFMVSGGNIQEMFSVQFADLVLFGAVVSGAYAWFLVKKLLVKGYSLTGINGIAMLIGGCLSLATSAFLETTPVVYDWSQFVWWVLALIVVSNLVVYNFYGWLLHKYSITFLTFAGFLCPAFAAIYDWLLGGGSMQHQYLMSLTLVTLGLYVFYRQELFMQKIDKL